MPKPTLARTLHFEALDDLLAEAKRIAARPDAPTRGNWSPAQNIWHVARYIQASVEGYPFTSPLWMRLLGPLLKRRMISKPMATGFNAPANVKRHMEPTGNAAGEVTMDTAIALMQAQVDAAKAKGFIPANPVFGKMTKDQWVALHCRHAEMHFGLIELKDD